MGDHTPRVGHFTDRAQDECELNATSRAEKPSDANLVREQTYALSQQGEERGQASERLVLAISRVQSLFIDDAEPESVFGVMLQEIQMLTGSDYGCIGEVLRDTEHQPYLRIHVIRGLAWNEETKALMARQIPNLEFTNLKTLLDQVMRTGRPVIANDPVNDPQASGLPPGLPSVNTFLGLPIFRGNQVTGVVGIANRPGGYDEGLVTYLEPFLAICAQLLDGYRQRQLRGEAESALHQSEERWQRIVRGCHDGIWDWNIATGKVFFSPRWKQMRGFEELEVTDSLAEWRDNVHPDDYERVMQVLEAYLTKRSQEFSEEYRVKRKDGTYIWVLDRGVASWNDEGVAVRMAGAESDITERKREEALQITERQTLELVAKGTSLNDVLTFLSQAIETHTAPALCSVMVVTEDGTHLSSAAGPSLPDEYRRLIDGIPIGPHGGSCGSAAFFRTLTITTDMTTDPLWKDYASVPTVYGLKACWSHPIVSSTGVLLGIFAVYYREPRSPQPADLKILDRASHIVALAIEHAYMMEAVKQSEARFQAFMRHSPAVTFIKDTGGRYVYGNPQFETLLGPSGRQILGKTVFDFMPTDIATRLSRIDQAVLASGQTFESEESLPTSDGTVQHWLIIKFPLDVARRELLGGIAIDISERKRVEESLLRTQFAMDQAVDAVYWIDPQARILYTNEAARAMLGYTAEEFLRMTVHDLNPDFPPAVWPGWWEETREKKVISLETAHLTKDGRRIPIDIRVAFLAYGGQEFHCAFVRDISERKRGDLALRESQERFELAVRATNEGIWDWNIPSGEQYWSERHLELFGLDPGALIPSYETWISLVHPDDAEWVQQATRRHLDTREPYDIEVRVRMKDGSYRWFRDRGQAVWDASGRAVRMVGSISDVTARRNAEEAIWKAHAELEQRVRERTKQLATVNRTLEEEIVQRKRVEERLHRTQYAVDHAADQIFVIGSNGFFLDVNESACRRLGYTKDELLTMSMMDIDPDLSSTVWDEMWHKLRDHGQLRVETGHRRKSGEVYPVEVVANYLEHNGQELNYAIVRDLTERRRAEAAIRESELRYKLVTEATFDAIALHDNGALLEVNTGLERMFGYQSGELLGRSILDLIADESREQIFQNMRTGATGPYEAVGRRKDGTTFPGEIVVRPYWYCGKQVRLVAGRDITVRKQLEAEKARYLQDLERQVAERTAKIAKLESQRAQTEKLAAVGQMAAAVAHEINNPIAGIRNAFTLVKQAVDQAHPHYEFVGMIDREISRVATIVQNMYQLYRKEPSKVEPVNLPQQLRDLEALFAKQVSQRGMTFVVTLSHPMMQLEVPQSDLLQILMNLVQNAIDSSRQGGTVRLHVKHDEDIVTISVSDEGSGIAPDVLPHIFDPFFTTKPEKGQKGMGLGLSVSQSLAMAMGGRIEVQTELGAGSTFSVVLPQLSAVDRSTAQRNIIKEVLTHET